MNACWRCGAPVNPNDKFCGTCASPLAGAGAPAGGPPGYGASPQAPAAQGFGPTPAQAFGAPAAQGFGPPMAAPAAQAAPLGPTEPAPSPGYGYGYGGAAPQAAPFVPPGVQPVPFAQQPYSPPPGGLPAQPPPGMGGGYAPSAPVSLQDMRIAGSEAFEAAAWAPDGAASQGLPPTGAMSPFPGAPAPLVPPFGPPPGMYANPPAAAPAHFEAQPGFDQGWESAATSPPADSQSQSVRELRAFLYSFHNDPAGAFWVVYSGSTSIGRAESGEQVDIEIADPTTSSRHAAFVSDAPGRLSLQDTASTNGTFVNDQSIGYQGACELHDGDRIRFGGFNAGIRFVTR